jgi:predicted trehalose synthase
MAELHAAFHALDDAESSGARGSTGGWAGHASDRAAAAWNRARAAIASVPGTSDTTQAAVSALLDRHDQVLTVIRTARDTRAEPVLTGVHGTLDLAHALIYQDDITFVGPASDPRIASDIRQRFDSPLVDLATMLWSLERAAAFALATRVSAAPLERDRLAVWARWWAAGAAASLMAAYRQAAAGMAFVPADDVAAVRLLELLILERAFDEVGQSASASPEWLATAVEAARGVLSSGGSNATR